MKKIIYGIGLVLLAAALVFSALSCNLSPEEIKTEVKDWLENNGGYTPVIIPKVEWLGLSAELGHYMYLAHGEMNIVNTTLKEDGSYTYLLSDGNEPSFDDSYHLLQINSVVGARFGTGAYPLTHDNFSANQPGILFMWDRVHEEKDNAGAADNYQRGYLKVHQNVFQKYPSFLLRIRFIDQTYLQYLIRPQRGLLKNLAGDSYIFLIKEATGLFNSNDPDSNYITNVWFEEYVDRETPAPEVPPPPAVYSITYMAVDGDGYDIADNEIIFADADDPIISPPELFTEGSSAIRFKVTAPQNYTLVDVKAGDQTLTPSADVYSLVPADDVIVTVRFDFTPPPPVIYNITYRAFDGDEQPLGGVFEGESGGTAPASVTSPERAAFTVITPDGTDLYEYELIEVKAGDTTLRVRAGGIYSFRPRGDVTVTAYFKKVLPPVDDYVEYQPTPDDDPYGTATFVTPADEIDVGGGARKIVIISVASEFGAEVDPEGRWLFSGKPIRTFYDDTIKKKDTARFNEMTAIRNSAGQRATYIWDRSDSWVYGISGCFTVITASRFDIGLDETVQNSNVWFYFACDNAAAVYVNGQLAGYTEAAFDQADAYRKKNKMKVLKADRPGPTSDWRFGGLDISDFSGENNTWENLYKVDIKRFLMQGHNEILIMAANNDSSNGRWNDTNNPAALLFASEFTVSK